MDGLGGLLKRAVGTDDLFAKCRYLRSLGSRLLFEALEALLQLFDLPLAADEAEFPFLRAAAGHGAAGVDDIPFKRGDAESTSGPLVDGNASVQIFYQHRSTQQVFKNTPVALLKTHQIAGNAQVAIHPAIRQLTIA